MSKPISNRSFVKIRLEDVPRTALSMNGSSFPRSVRGDSAPIPRKIAIQDCLFLIATVLLSGMPYVAKLGFYADDWAFLGSRHRVKEHSPAAIFHSLGPTIQSILGVRPGQTIYQVLTYFCFGLNPLPYHVIATIALAAVAALFYMSLREVRLPRYLVLSVPLIYALLPHYATDRFWFAAHQAIFSQALFLFGFYAAFRATRSDHGMALFLNLISAASFALALLFYEVIVGLLPLVFLLIGYGIFMARLGSGDSSRKSISAAVTYVSLDVICVGATLAYKMRMTDRVLSPLHHAESMHAGSFLWKALDMTIRFNVLHYGVGLPRVAFQLWRFAGLDKLSIISAVVISASVIVYCSFAFRNPHVAVLRRDMALSMIFIGFLIFAVDYAPFSTLKSSFSYDGDNNRVAIAAAMGAAFVLAGGTALLIGMIIPGRLQSIAFVGAMAVICCLNFICIACFANCWSKAYTEQREIVASVRRNLSLASGSTIILDGFCRYVGPAPVLQNSHDATGALRIAYDDDTLQADVVSPELEIGDGSIRTFPFGIEQHYAYQEKLILFSVNRLTALRVTDGQVIRTYIQTTNPDKNSGCPIGWEGMGSPIK